MEDGFLGLQDWPTLFKGSDYVDVLSDLAFLYQGEQSLLQLMGLDGVSFVERVQPYLFWKDIRLLFGKLGSYDRMAADGPSPFLQHFGRL